MTKRLIRVCTKDPAKKKEVFCGLIEDTTFIRSVSKEHFMEKENGYGIQIDVIEKLVKYGVKKIFLHMKNGTKLSSHLSDWVCYGHKKNYGNGVQIFLHTKYMQSF